MAAVTCPLPSITALHTNHYTVQLDLFEQDSPAGSFLPTALPSGLFHEWSGTTQTRETYPPQHWHLVAELPFNTRPQSHHPHIRSAAALGKKFNAEQITSCYLMYYLFRPSCWGWTITAQVVLWIHNQCSYHWCGDGRRLTLVNKKSNISWKM